MRRSRSKAVLAALGAVAVLAVAAALRFAPDGLRAEPPEAERREAAVESARPHRYEVEYGVIGYLTATPSNRVERLRERLAAGDVALDGSNPKAALAALLAALEIDPSSQALVFSRTSLQTSGISAATPRAIYFNDDTYVAYVQNADPPFEIATFDPTLGAIFYTLEPATPAPRVERQLDRCLRCHDAYSLSGGGVPRLITGSGYTDAGGRLVSHEGWILTSDRTPLRSRWGGWYVSGRHGSQVHLGNVIIRDFSDFERLDELRTGNLDDLDGVVDTSAYLTNTSDIVALLILEHQVRVQNAITRASWDTQVALAESGGQADAPSVAARLAAINEPLVEALFLSGEAPLTDRIEGTSGFAEHFASRGPRDAQGRSLRDLDLERRLFRHPLSYVIYSDGFAALPEASKTYVYRRLGEILRGADERDAYAHLTAEDRAAIAEILRDTAPEIHAAAGL